MQNEFTEEQTLELCPSYCWCNQWEATVSNDVFALSLFGGGIDFQSKAFDGTSPCAAEDHDAMAVKEIDDPTFNLLALVMARG